MNADRQRFWGSILAIFGNFGDFWQLIDPRQSALIRVDPR